MSTWWFGVSVYLAVGFVVARLVYGFLVKLMNDSSPDNEWYPQLHLLSSQAEQLGLPLFIAVLVACWPVPVWACIRAKLKKGA